MNIRVSVADLWRCDSALPFLICYLRLVSPYADVIVIQVISVYNESLELSSNNGGLFESAVPI